MGFLPAKDMSGYGPAGRGAIIPERIPRKNPQQKNFCTTHLHFENRSFVEFTEKNEHHGGDVGENCCFPYVKRVSLW